MLNKTIHHLTILAVLLLLPSVHAADLPPLTHGLTDIKNKGPAPALRFNDMDEELVDITKLRGKVVVVNFWATWCPPCRREMGSLERLYQATSDKGVEILAVNIGEDPDLVFSFLGTVEPSPSFPILFDTNADSMGQWKVKGLPTTYVVGPDGNLAYRATGGREFDHPDIIRQVTSLHKQ